MLGLLLGAAAGAAAAAPIEVRASPVPLDARDRGATRVGALHYVAGFVLHSSAAGWGGFSGMVLAPDGSALLAVSDLGYWLALELSHGPDGRLLGVGAARLWPMLGRNGVPLAGKVESDAEGLARDADGTLLVAFEQDHRLWRYGDPDGRPEPVAAPPAIRALPANGGIEAVASMAAGRLLILSESGTNAAGDTLGWLRDDGQWFEIGVERTGLFEPTDLAPLPDGDLLLLERRYTPVGGPAARLSRLREAAIAPGARLVPRPLGEIRLPQTVDNFEAAAARPAPDGSTLIYLLSDDNRNPLQRTLLLQFRLRE